MGRAGVAAAGAGPGREGGAGSGAAGPPGPLGKQSHSRGRAAQRSLAGHRGRARRRSRRGCASPGAGGPRALRPGRVRGGWEQPGPGLPLRRRRPLCRVSVRPSIRLSAAPPLSWPRPSGRPGCWGSVGVAGGRWAPGGLGRGGDAGCGAAAREPRPGPPGAAPRPRVVHQPRSPGSQVGRGGIGLPHRRRPDPRPGLGLSAGDPEGWGLAPRGT